MTALVALIRKDLILYLSNRRALLINLLMPIVLAAFMGFLFGGSGNSARAKVDVALVNLDHSAVGQRIGAGLHADASLTIHDLDAAQAQDKVRQGKLNAAIVIPDGFGEAAGAALFNAAGKPAITIYYDPSQSMTLAMVKGMLTQQVMQVVSAEMFGGAGGRALTDKSLRLLEARAASGQADPPLMQFLGSLKTFQNSRPALAAASASASASASGEPARGLAMPFTTQEQALSAGPRYNGFAHSFAGMGVQFILFFAIDVAIGVLLARRLGIWNRLLAAPVSQTTILLARALSCAIIAFFLMCAIFAAAVLLFQVRITGSVAGFLAVVAGFSLMTACFGLLIAAFGKTPEAARGIASFATLVMVMLGGAWVPVFIFPQWLQQATLIMPTRWAVDGLDAMTWRGLDTGVALQATAVQLGFALLFGVLALWKFGRTAQEA